MIVPTETEQPAARHSTTHELALIDAYWRAANYLSVGQIYLLDNPLLRRPLAAEDIKPRLLGHWGTTPGLNFIWAHANRVIKAARPRRDHDRRPGSRRTGGGGQRVPRRHLVGALLGRRPGRGGRAHSCFASFSFPGGIGSHVTPEVPGSIHEGGELGYSLAHAFGAVFDNPDLVAFCVVGDGEAETGSLATSWHSNKFVSPVRDGTVLPILHLNGYKIANPSFLARIPEHELRALFEGYGYHPLFVSGDDPPTMHREFAAVLDQALDEIAAIQSAARIGGGDGAAALADDRLSLAEGLDGAEGGRRPAHRRHLALAPGSARRRARGSRTPGPARAMAA